LKVIKREIPTRRTHDGREERLLVTPRRQKEIPQNNQKKELHTMIGESFLQKPKKGVIRGFFPS
jgi:hypothetical protein